MPEALLEFCRTGTPGPSKTHFAGSIMPLIAHQRALEMVADGESLTAILEELCDTIDAQSSGIISFVMLVDPDGNCLQLAAGRRIPSGFARTLNSVPVGADFRDSALSHGLQSGWS